MFKFGKKKEKIPDSSSSSIQSISNSQPISTASDVSIHASATSVVAPATSSEKIDSVSGTVLIRIVEAVGIPVINLNNLPYIVIDVDKNEIVAKAKSGNEKSIYFYHQATFDVSRKTPIEISIFISSEKEDVLLGTANMTPSFSDQKPHDEWFPVQSTSNQENIAVRIQSLFKPNKNKPMSIDDFDLLKVIGKGSFGKVMQVRKRDSNRIYAMKILKKSHIVQRDEVSHTLAERLVLAKLQHPFIVNLKYSFQSKEKLYLVLAFVNGGELFFHLQVENKFSEPRAKFYTAELLSALECLHSYNVIYRDLKPENILLDFTGHIALCDFGLCKLNMNDGKKTNTFCGTPEYLAPEVLIGKGYTKAVDWWTLGILLFEMLTGLPPFYDENVNAMYKKILSDPLIIPEGVSPVAEDLLRKLLERNPALRLGNQGAQQIKSHAFFNDVDWRRLIARKYTPPFRPNVSSAQDTSNFDNEFTNEIPIDSVADTSLLSDAVQQQFKGFTYQGHEAIAGSLSNSVVMNRMGSMNNSHQISSIQELSKALAEKTITE